MNAKIRTLGGYLGFYLLIILVALTINARFNSLNETNNQPKNKIVAANNN